MKLRKLYIKGGGLLFLILLSVTAFAQYAVTGGRGTPLLAGDDTKNRIQVYMVYGMDNVEIRYTSSSTSHSWFRYKTNANSAEPVASRQEGTTSVVSNVEEGYGYFVKETETTGINKFVWIIDYSKYAFDIQSLNGVEDDAKCFVMKLEGAATMPELSYYTPNGFKTVIERSFDVTYQTLDKETLSTITNTETVDDPFNFDYATPYCDTEITLSGDQFARHFGVEKTMSTGTYQATALLVKADTLLLTTEGTNAMAGDGSSLSAPAEVQFTAHANEPVAANFRWDIYRQDDGQPLLSFNGSEVSYTFLYAGTYNVKLEVNDRTTLCTDSTQSFTIIIRESDLQVPNAFSPGTSPGVNDEFRVAYKSLIRFKGWIFNRWGVEMFQWTDPARGWDGKKGGKYVAPGVYFYVIEAEGSDGHKYKKSGSINIIRSKNVQDQVTQ